MMKRMTALILAVVFLLAMSTVAFAAENDAEKSSNAEARSTSTNLAKTVTVGGVTFALSGYCYVIGTQPAAYSSVSIKNYNTTSQTEITAINNAAKTLGAGGLVTSFGESSFSGVKYFTGASSTYTKVGSALSATIQYITGNHYITYNGGTGQGSSWYSKV